jgi:hypothetical protein
LLSTLRKDLAAGIRLSTPSFRAGKHAGSS